MPTKEEILEILNHNMDSQLLTSNLMEEIRETAIFKANLTIALIFAAHDPIYVIESATAASLIIGLELGIELGKREALKEMCEGK